MKDRWRSGWSWMVVCVFMLVLGVYFAPGCRTIPEVAELEQVEVERIGEVLALGYIAGYGELGSDAVEAIEAVRSIANVTKAMEGLGMDDVDAFRLAVLRSIKQWDTSDENRQIAAAVFDLAWGEVRAQVKAGDLSASEAMDLFLAMMTSFEETIRLHNDASAVTRRIGGEDRTVYVLVERGRVLTTDEMPTSLGRMCFNE